ncbi:MAG: ABC transporter substrate-binding protein [Candidatus Marinimicrobia bacterium]|nr:ABC transporter substrate-binding protein [Candidatus Neomarinimicrobiota bacterium]
MATDWKYLTVGLLTGIILLLFVLVRPDSEIIDDGKTHIRYWQITGQKDVESYPVRAFNALQDQIVIEATSIPWQDHEKKILTAVLSGNPPDIVSQFVPVVKWASRMALLPLDSFMRRDNFDPEIFFPALWEEMSYQDHIFAVPIFTVSMAFAYNKRLFREVGLDPENPPEDWSEVKRVAKLLDRRNEKGQFIQMGFIPDWLSLQTRTLQTSMLMAWQLGAEFLSPDGKIINLNNPAMIKALQWVVDYYDQYDMDRVQSFRGSFGYADQNEFISEKVAMMVIDSSFPEQIERYKNDLDYGIAAIPSFEGSPSASSSGSFWLGIPRGAKNPAAAWEFIKFFVQKDTQLETCFETEENLFPANRRAAYDTSFNTSEMIDVFVHQMDFAHSPSIVPMAHDVFWREMAQRVQERVVLHLQTPEESLLEAQYIIQLELDKALRYDEFVRSKINIADIDR